jgi:hypothetical protein
MRTTVDIAEPLLNNAKRQAEKRGVTLSTVVEDALRVLFSVKKATPVREFKLITVGGPPVDPAMDLNRTSQLLLDEEEERYRKNRS